MLRLVNVVVLGLALVACSAPERTRPARPAGALLVPPGLRLPDLATPLAYELRLDLDPERESFDGEVWIKIRIDQPTDHIWLHADRLQIRSARWDGGDLALDPVLGDQMRAFRFGRVVQPGTITVVVEYSGSLLTDQEGLFRQRAGDHWYLFSQGEAVYTRRFAPCFDEPRWKTPWRITLVVPTHQVALSNMPERQTRVLGDRTKEVSFETTGPIPSYLVAIAVGPFDLVDAGTLGAQKRPLRVAVRAGGRGNVGVVAAKLPAVVDALEAYMGEPLPGLKLDVVAVPHLFGAMENPGLITFDEPMLVGMAKDKGFSGYFVQIAAHEVVHQWFGNLVTPAWWNDLWLSEAFASWLGDKIARQLGAIDDAALHFALARRRAIEADDEADAVPLRRPIMTNKDPDESFDAIYEKGQTVLATFETWLGEDKFRDMLRGFVAAHRDASATAHDLAAALGDAGPAFEQFLTTTGVPVVDLALRCEGKPQLTLHARGGRSVPVCIRYAGARDPVDTCVLAGETTALPLPSCPAWVVGNRRGGYYHVAWTTHGPRGPAAKLGQLDDTQRIIAGDDLAAAVARGELNAKDALAELRTLADSRDAYAQLGAIAIATRLDNYVPDASRSAWTAWLAARFANRLAPGGSSSAERQLGDQVIAALPDRVSSATTRRALDTVDKLITGSQDVPTDLVAVAAVAGGDKLFARLVDRVRVVADAELRDQYLRALGAFGQAQIARAIDLLVDRTLPPQQSWKIVEGFFDRAATRAATWRALRARMGEVLKRMSAAEEADVIDATAGLCDSVARDQVALVFAARIRSIPDGKRHYDAALASIDRCIATTAKLGDIAAAIAASR